MRLFFVLISLMLISCTNDYEDFTENFDDYVPTSLKTENVIILVIDGPRMSETWNEPNKQYIPDRIKLMQEGVLISNFMNKGTTLTVSGHSSILNGTYENLDNNGTETPINPSLFQYFLKDKKLPNDKAWIIASKSKLKVLANCTDPKWKDQYLPKIDTGNANNTNRTDVLTIESFKNTLTKSSPNLVMINLKDLDIAGHENNWDGYIEAIKNTDRQIKEVWDFIQSDANYKDKTTLIVTNDHGRHDDNNGGFQSHGDKCKGCQHIEFFAIGPDFKKNTIINLGNYEQKDIAKTIGILLNFPLENSDGKVIKDIFINPYFIR